MAGSDEDFDGDFDFAADKPAPSHPDADRDSPTLRRYHQMLWSKPLQSGCMLELEAPTVRGRGYLIASDGNGNQLWFGSDAITNSYTGWLRPKALADAMAALNPGQKARYLHPRYTVGSTMIWPVRSKDRPTINQARGTRAAIADRMDLTLECIRRHYEGGQPSPLADVLLAYADFFALFDGFEEFVDFFHFRDLVASDDGSIRFYLPYEDFQRPGTPRTVEEYVTYMEATLAFIAARQRRMVQWVAQHGNGHAGSAT